MRASALLALFLVLAIPARAAEHIVEVKWSPAGEFAVELDIAPKKIKELCVGLKKGQSVAWSFSADGPTAFNIHYHEGSEVTHPVKRDGVVSDRGALAVAADHDYCWMWRAAPEQRARVAVTLKRTGR